MGPQRAGEAGRLRKAEESRIGTSFHLLFKLLKFPSTFMVRVTIQIPAR